MPPAIVKYKLTKKDLWRTVVDERHKPRIYPNRLIARRKALHFRSRRKPRPFYFRIEPWA